MANSVEGVTRPVESSISDAVLLTSPNVSGPTVKPCTSATALATTDPDELLSGATDAVDVTKAALPTRPV
jgi:hypothetical protein